MKKPVNKGGTEQSQYNQEKKKKMRQTVLTSRW